jgi:hypothetical protein
MATYEIWKTVTYEAVCFIEADSLEEAKQALNNEAQDWEAIDGENTTYTIDGVDFTDDELLEEEAK